MRSELSSMRGCGVFAAKLDLPEQTWGCMDKGHAWIMERQCTQYGIRLVRKVEGDVSPIRTFTGQIGVISAARLGKFSFWGMRLVRRRS